MDFAKADMWQEAVSSAEAGVLELPADNGAKYTLAVIYQAVGRHQDCEKVLKQLIGIEAKSKYIDLLKENKQMWAKALEFERQMKG